MNLQVEPFYKPDRNPYRSLKGTLFVDEDLEKLGARFKQCTTYGKGPKPGSGSRNRNLLCPRAYVCLKEHPLECIGTNINEQQMKFITT